MLAAQILLEVDMAHVDDQAESSRGRPQGQPASQ